MCISSASGGLKFFEKRSLLVKANKVLHQNRLWKVITKQTDTKATLKRTPSVCLTAVVVISLSRMLILSMSSAAAYVQKYNVPGNRVVNSLITIFIIFTISRLLTIVVVRQVKDVPTHDNLNRLLSLSVALLVVFIITRQFI